MPKKKIKRTSESETVLKTAIISAFATIVVALVGIAAPLITNLNAKPTPTSPTGISTRTPTPEVVPASPTPTKPTTSPTIPEIFRNESTTQILITVIASLVTIFAAVIATFGRLLTERKLSTSSTSTPASRLQKLIDDLSKSSSEADVLIREITDDLKKRQIAMTELQSQNADLAAQEAELRKRIDLLKDMPIEVAEYFQKINEQNLQTVDKRSSRRDFQFFVLGIVVSTIIAIILRALGLG
ncbi:MAG: hypothetical protein MHPDNHAH_01078 [Anaerolineales bacterium]|nr:hypothetical protein [Anaerolineales bacterium]